MPCLALLGCGPRVELPADCVSAPERAERVVSSLGGIAGLEALVVQDARDRICFERGPGTLRPGPVFALPSDTSDEEAAARLAHLLHHVRHGRGLVARTAIPADADCDALVDEALREEARAHVLEMEVRQALRVTHPSRPFDDESEVLALPGEARVERVLTFLREHPDGGGGYEPLGRDYRARCVR